MHSKKALSCRPKQQVQHLK
ncbi:hypothetical protein Hamer_G005452 [Homarus americanus]|uniref:Uncharacterized protein n=1 Tax=Homarus americanus TaxID=6706 RepID=A0A8J5JZ28_HOMAM|nr:hypothetical protein Hamer_G005452 [Homarus americanus]